MDNTSDIVNLKVKSQKTRRHSVTLNWVVQTNRDIFTLANLFVTPIHIKNMCVCMCVYIYSSSQITYRHHGSVVMISSSSVIIILMITGNNGIYRCLDTRLEMDSTPLPIRAKARKIIIERIPRHYIQRIIIKHLS